MKLYISCYIDSFALGFGPKCIQVSEVHPAHPGIVSHFIDSIFSSFCCLSSNVLHSQ